MRTSKFLFISLILIALSLFGEVKAQQDATTASTTSTSGTTAQGEEREAKKEPKIVIVKDQGLALGIDLSPFIIRAVKDERTGFCVVGRYGVKNRWFAAAEVGFEHIKYAKKNYDYKSNGSYVRIGMDYDIFNSEDAPTNDNVFVGLRYAYAWQQHESGKFTIVDDYWGDYEGSVGKTSVNSHSVDLLGGIRCEMLRNLYMGWTFRCRFLLASKHSDDLKPYAIAGYGNYDNKVAIGFSYTIEYQIPFNKLGKKK